MTFEDIIQKALLRFAHNTVSISYIISAHS